MIHKSLLFDKKQNCSKDTYISSSLFDIPLLKFGSSPSKTLHILKSLSMSKRLLPHFQQRCSKTCIVEQGWFQGKKIDINNFNFLSLQVRYCGSSVTPHPTHTVGI